MSFHLSVGEPVEDCLVWNLSSSGKFFINSAIEFLIHSTADNVYSGFNWSKIWHWLGPQRVKMFMWLVARNRLRLTNQERRRRHLKAHSTCQRCHEADKTEIHALRDCPATRQIWSSIVHPHMKQNFFSQDLEDWILSNIDSKTICFSDISWSLLFGFTVWKCWKF